MAPKLGDIILFDLTEGAESFQWPAIVMEDTDEGRTVGLLVFARTPFYVPNYILPDTDVPVDDEPVTVPTPSGADPVDPTVTGGSTDLSGLSLAGLTTTATPIGDSVPPPAE